LTILKCLFKSCFKEGDAFLRLAITGNDTWIHHYATERKRQVMETSHITNQKEVKNKQRRNA
jgi:hypothetical protein